MANNYKTLVRKNVVLDTGLVNQDGNIISLGKISLQTGSKDPRSVQIPDIATVAEMIEDLKQSPFEVLYKVIINDTNVYPDATVLNQLYDGTGIFVEEIATGNQVVLVRYPHPDPINYKMLYDKEGILFVVLSTGKYQTAGFIGKTIVIDTTKNTSQDVINGISTRITDAARDVANLKTRVDTLDVSNIKMENNKDISGRGGIQAGTVITDANKIPTRGEVKSGLETLKSTIDATVAKADTNTQGIATINGTINGTINPAITAIQTKATLNATNIATNAGAIATTVAKDAAQDAIITQHTSEIDALKSVDTTFATRIASLESTGASNFISAIIKYASENGTPPKVAPTVTSAQFDLKDLKDANAGSETDLKLVDEDVLSVKIRFKLVGTSATGDDAFKNIIFNINVADKESTIIELKDGDGTTGKLGYLTAQLAIDGTLTIKCIDQNGADLTVSQIIDFSTLRIHEIQKIGFVKTGSIVSQADFTPVLTNVSLALSKANTNEGNIATNTASIAAANAEITTAKNNITTITSAIGSANTQINGDTATGGTTKGILPTLTELKTAIDTTNSSLSTNYQTKTDIRLTTGNLDVVDSINNLASNKGDKTQVDANTTNLNNVNRDLTGKIAAKQDKIAAAPNVVIDPTKTYEVKFIANGDGTFTPQWVEGGGGGTQQATWETTSVNDSIFMSVRGGILGGEVISGVTGIYPGWNSQIVSISKFSESNKEVSIWQSDVNGTLNTIRFKPDPTTIAFDRASNLETTGYKLKIG